MGIRKETLTMTIFDTFAENDVAEDEGLNRGEIQEMQLNAPKMKFDGGFSAINMLDHAKLKKEREKRMREVRKIRRQLKHKIVLINIFKFFILVSVIILSLVSAQKLAFVFTILNCIFGMPIYFILPGYLHLLYGNQNGLSSKILDYIIILYGVFLMVSVPIYYFVVIS